MRCNAVRWGGNDGRRVVGCCAAELLGCAAAGLKGEPARRCSTLGSRHSTLDTPALQLRLSHLHACPTLLFPPITAPHPCVNCHSQPLQSLRIQLVERCTPPLCPCPLAERLHPLLLPLCACSG